MAFFDLDKMKPINWNTVSFADGIDMLFHAFIFLFVSIAILFVSSFKVVKKVFQNGRRKI